MSASSAFSPEMIQIPARIVPRPRGPGNELPGSDGYRVTWNRGLESTEIGQRRRMSFIFIDFQFRSGPTTNLFRFVPIT